MTALRHPNVVLFMAACTKPPKMCIVMEFMSLGSLYDVRALQSHVIDWRRLTPRVFVVPPINSCFTTSSFLRFRSSSR